MSDLPRRCVVDTNVATTANGLNATAPPHCVAASAKALQSLMTDGHIFIDDEQRILKEYRANLSPGGQPGPGDAFLKWLLTHEWVSERVTRVRITPVSGDVENYAELVPGTPPVNYDPSDRKFLAVAAAHLEHPPVLQSFDSKWWGWRQSLATTGISVYFVCEKDIAAKHAEKSGR